MKTILYLGTDPTQFESQSYFEGHLIHFPIIKIVPRPLTDPEIRAAYDDLDEYTHLIFTSKNAVWVFFQHLQALGKTSGNLQNKQIIAIGTVTGAHLTQRGLPPHLTAEQETQEGVVALLNTLDIEDSYFFLPRSALSRPVLVDFFTEREIRYQACDLYDTVTHITHPLPDLDRVDEIIFTSPSTVSAFLQIFGKPPPGKKLLTIGPVTESALRECLAKSQENCGNSLRRV